MKIIKTKKYIKIARHNWENIGKEALLVSYLAGKAFDRQFPALTRMGLLLDRGEMLDYQNIKGVIDEAHTIMNLNSSNPKALMPRRKYLAILAGLTVFCYELLCGDGDMQLLRQRYPKELERLDKLDEQEKQEWDDKGDNNINNV